MTQYRKKPVVIEAVQFDGLNPTEIKDFVGENCEVEIYDNKVTPPIANITIHTLEGDMEVSNGDYVIKGVKGEFYPCKPDIFEQTYESVETKKDLEKAVEEYFYHNWSDGSLDIKPQVEEDFKAGAEWQKEQMLRDAVDGEAHPDDCEIWCNLIGYGYKYKKGDKIKIIIVKEG